MTDHAARLIKSGHWTLKLAFLVGVAFTGLLLVGEVLSMPAIGALISGLLPYEICDMLASMEKPFPWASFLLIVLLIAPFTIGQAAAARILGKAIDKVPGP